MRAARIAESRSIATSGRARLAEPVDVAADFVLEPTDRANAARKALDQHRTT
jgi:hypothetical protein